MVFCFLMVLESKPRALLMPGRFSPLNHISSPHISPSVIHLHFKITTWKRDEPEIIDEKAWDEFLQGQVRTEHDLPSCSSPFLQCGAQPPQSTDEPRLSRLKDLSVPKLYPAGLSQPIPLLCPSLGSPVLLSERTTEGQVLAFLSQGSWRS